MIPSEQMVNVGKNAAAASVLRLESLHLPAVGTINTLNFLFRSVNAGAAVSP